MNTKDIYKILVIEPDLANRKALAQLIQNSNFQLTYIETFEEATDFISHDIPHMVFINLDHHPKQDLKDTAELLSRIPQETIVFVMTEKNTSQAVIDLVNFGVNEICKKPINSIHVRSRIKIYTDALKPLAAKVRTDYRITANIKAEIVGLSETDFIIESGIIPETGERLLIDSPLITSILDDEKYYIVSENKNERFSSKYQHTELTILGLNNVDLQKIRSKITRWEKL